MPQGVTSIVGKAVYSDVYIYIYKILQKFFWRYYDPHFDHNIALTIGGGRRF